MSVFDNIKSLVLHAWLVGRQGYIIYDKQSRIHVFNYLIESLRIKKTFKDSEISIFFLVTMHLPISKPDKLQMCFLNPNFIPISLVELARF